MLAVFSWHRGETEVMNERSKGLESTLMAAHLRLQTVIRFMAYYESLHDQSTNNTINN